RATRCTGTCTTWSSRRSRSRCRSGCAGRGGASGTAGPTDMPYEPELQAALDAVESARPAILDAYAGFEPIPDAAASITLPIDRQTQDVLLRHLAARFPDDAFCAEEETPALAGLAGPGSGRPRMWIIDPIDGTRGFAMKNGEFSVM